MLVLFATSSATTAYSMILFCGESSSSQILTKGVDDTMMRETKLTVLLIMGYFVIILFVIFSCIECQHFTCRDSGSWLVPN